MITYPALYMFVGLNLLILGVLFLIIQVRRKTGWLVFLGLVVWLAFSWYYGLRISKHLPYDLWSRHYLLALFLTVFYGFGQYISVIGVFIGGVVFVGQLLNPDIETDKSGKCKQKAPAPAPSLSPWLIWTTAMAVGILSGVLLKAGMLPHLSRVMGLETEFIYRKVLHLQPYFPSVYMPAAGIAAGTIVTACITPVYRRSASTVLGLPALVLVPVLTAVLAPLVDFGGCMLVIVLVMAAFQMKGSDYGIRRRNCLPFVLSALAIGALSGLYFQAGGVTFADEKAFALVGGLVAGITIACLGFVSYVSQDNKFRALFFLGFIPFCTPGFGGLVAYVVSLVTAILFMAMSIGKTREYSDTGMRTAEGGIVQSNASGRLRFVEGSRIVEADELEPNSGIFKDIRTGRTYKSNGFVVQAWW